MDNKELDLYLNMIDAMLANNIDKDHVIAVLLDMDVYDELSNVSVLELMAWCTTNYPGELETQTESFESMMAVLSIQCDEEGY